MLLFHLQTESGAIFPGKGTHFHGKRDQGIKRNEFCGIHFIDLIDDIAPQHAVIDNRQDFAGLFQHGFTLTASYHLSFKEQAFILSIQL